MVIEVGSRERAEAVAAFVEFLDGLHTTKAVAVIGIPPSCLGGSVSVLKTSEGGSSVALLWPSGRLALSKPDALNLLLALAREVLPVERPFDALATLIPVAK